MNMENPMYRLTQPQKKCQFLQRLAFHAIDKSLIRCVPLSLPTCEFSDGFANIRQGADGFHASILKGIKFFVCSALPT